MDDFLKEIQGCSFTTTEASSNDDDGLVEGDELVVKIEKSEPVMVVKIDKSVKDLEESLDPNSEHMLRKMKSEEMGGKICDIIMNLYKHVIRLGGLHEKMPPECTCECPVHCVDAYWLTIKAPRGRSTKRAVSSENSDQPSPKEKKSK